MPCYIVQKGFFICGDLGPHCRECGDVSGYLCDFPVGKRGKTCDAPLCEACAKEVAPDTHYCTAHHGEWQKFVNEGGVKQVLENVVPYKTETKKGNGDG